MDRAAPLRGESPIRRWCLRVVLNANEQGCWDFRCARDVGGYSRFAILGKGYKAHRWGYERFVGPVPDGLCLDHLCRNRWCVNPEHLEPVTQSVNIRRGDLPAKAALRFTSRTHCPHGHEYTVENTYRNPHNNGRVCRACWGKRGKLRVKKHRDLVSARGQSLD